MRYIISAALASTALCAPALAEVPRVVTDMTPTYGLVATVMGDLGQPERLLDQGANAHGFQLRPSQAAALSDAGLVVWMGPQMSPWLDRALDGVANGQQLRLLEVAGTHLQPFGEGHEDHDHDHDHGAGAGHESHDPAAETGHDDADHDHAGEAGHDDHDDHDAHGHDHSGTDPHAWLDPANGAIWLEAIAAQLAALDPENAATYAANAAKGKEAIAAADARIAAQLAPVQDKPIVVFHDAYGYFAGHYGLTIAGSVSAGDAAAPGAAHLAELRARVGAGVACLFPEAGHAPKTIEQIAEAAGARQGGALDPAGVTLPASADGYTAVLEGLASTLADCLTAP